MDLYVDINAIPGGDGSKEKPFAKIGDAAGAAQAGDTVHVAPGIYREYVDPANSGTEDKRITYVSREPLGAVITGAEKARGCTHYDGPVWMCRINNEIFGDYNPYTTIVYGDWFFAKADKHTGCVYLNDKALYEVSTLEECIEGKASEYSWAPEDSVCKWYTEQDEERGETVIYANFGGAVDPNNEKVELNVRRECFMPSKTGVGYITVRGFRIDKAATTWAPPAAFQDGMIGPNWSKGWIIEDCEICNSKCAGISLGRYYDPDNNNYFSTRYVKSPTQMERDSVCRGQYHGWLKENIGSHIIRRNNIHDCQQGGIIGRMGGVFSVIEDNHIHHINNMMELGGAEIAGIKMHAAIDVIIRRNHIHHSTMGIWCDWEAQGTRITGNLLHDNQRPEGAKQLKGGMMSQDLFVEVSHGPTLIDNNILLSDVSLRFATQGVALVHNLIAGAFTCVGAGTDWRYTPYHIPHRTEVMGFMTILHGDNRFYNNIFIQNWPAEDFLILHDTDDGSEKENRQAGTWCFDEYPSYEEWISQFDFAHPANMVELEKAHFGHLPVWSEGNVFLNGAKPSRHDKDALTADGVHLEVKLEDGKAKIVTDCDLSSIACKMIDSDVLGKAFEPEARFEAPDGTAIIFDTDYNGCARTGKIIPGPLAADSVCRQIR
ncbi:MAG: right-handed parallel beta-helix repeat-containing protein [Mogibacterium sp.]|nr:right-handed parallel beta-helix repeat-containing protein [Mogibacterium sp.]